jgi:uncharacterized protein (TIGR02217 family)
MVEPFLNMRFPTDVSLGARGGPVRRTDVATLASGHERRISRWATARRRFDVGYGVRCREDAEAVLAFFEIANGQASAFRFRDPFDFKSCAADTDVSAVDQPLGTGDGIRTAFQLTKTYAYGDFSQSRAIDLPVPGSVVVAVDGAPAANVGVDHLTGVVTFATPPPAGTAVTAGFLFDIAARFESDELAFGLEGRGIEVADIPIVEVRR